MITAKCLRNYNGKKYDPAVGALFTELCEISYEKPDYGGIDGAIKRYKDLGFTAVKKIENKQYDTQVYIVSNSTDIVVVWRGSESKKDWENNFKFWPRKTKDLKTDEDLEKVATTMTKLGNIHHGFYLAMGSVFDEIKAYILSIPNYRTMSLYTTGHSLGGADSELFFVFFDGIAPFDAAYPLAAPKVGQKDFKKQANKIAKGRVYRVQYDGDVVTHVPPNFGFKHYGKLVYIDLAGKIHTNSWVIHRFWDKLTGLIWPFGKQRGPIDTHHPCWYYNHQAKAAGDSRRLQRWAEYREGK